MNIPMKWLTDYVDIDSDIVTFTDAMTMSGSKVEGYEKLGEDINLVVVGVILEIKQHPDADKLVITQIDVGSEVIQIVTGADNINVNDYIPVALNGSTLPGGLKIKNGKLRGIESNGMLCSIEELGFTTEEFPDAPAHGIFILDQPYELGMDVKKIFGLDDIIVEYEVTSNRPDCFSVLGIAREAAATFNKAFKYPEMVYEEIKGNPSDYASVTIEDEKLCPRYIGKIIQDVKIAPSPKWLQQKLRAAGVRPINNIVDITNFIMIEMGQPMHAFDVETLEDKKIIVRKAKEGEKIITLDNEERTLDSSMLVIADAKKPIAIAGVIGGNNTKITDKTTTILFEAANFEGTSIRLTSKKLGVRTDASTKYEKYLDPNNVEAATNRACQLVVMLGAGKVVEGVIDVYPLKRLPVTIAYNADKINRLLGTNISEVEMVNIFKRLEFSVNQEARNVIVPTFRPDLSCEADLAEEVARIYGYDKIPVTLATGTPTVGKKSFKQKIEDITHIVMEDCGLSEAMTYSFESPKVFNKLNVPEGHELRNTVAISNPLGEDFSNMRTTTVNGMLNALSTNYNRRNEAVKLYELGTIYVPKSLPLTELPNELLKLTIGLYGSCDFYDAKGVIETLIEKFGFIDKISYDPKIEVPFLHPGRRAGILVNGNKELGYIGEVHPTVSDQYEIGERAYIAVVDMSLLIKYANLDHSYQQIARYPAVNRDIAFLVKDEVIVQDIENILKQRCGKILEGFKLFDVYKGAQIEEGYKSIAYSLVFRSNDHTLSEKEINKVMSKVVNGLEFDLGAKLRQ
ncbi:MAG: phenylalanine--tRNA ligase subunit beta [Firmicutes bacterium HGW-Firmicutes-7]|nr:MAG: phenylalanine--tRNA ligase subunit beta [Firmicutes bacterium HGW-Firmicutes-7]